ncbi:hypothetical protein PWT90_02927 [Aphanocladium album]|nr:hypothetical protein PWT90_02927 [Aphanocladium album]
MILCIAMQYGIPDATSAREGNELAIYEEFIDMYAQKDFDQFYAAMIPKIPKGSGPIVYNLNGANAPAQPGEAGVESDLDFEMIKCNDLKQPDVVSTSWGGTEHPDDLKLGSTYLPPGGGFSNIFPRPDWQNEAVSTYLGKYVPNECIYDRCGRGYPDISAAGDDGVVAANGEIFFEGGTSKSAPIFAAIITRINEERLNAGKMAPGFLSPALYKGYAKGTFINIVKGNQGHKSKACGTNQAFVASPGCDPVTGLGTPKYGQMLEYFGAL